MYRLVNLLALQLKDVFPELHKQEDYVTRVVHEEEISFLRTLDKGLKRIENVSGAISGEQAFELYDTFGFPFDLTVTFCSSSAQPVASRRPMLRRIFTMESLYLISIFFVGMMLSR